MSLFQPGSDPTRSKYEYGKFQLERRGDVEAVSLEIIPEVFKKGIELGHIGCNRFPHVFSELPENPFCIFDTLSKRISNGPNVLGLTCFEVLNLSEVLFSDFTHPDYLEKEKEYIDSFTVPIILEQETLDLEVAQRMKHNIDSIPALQAGFNSLLANPLVLRNILSYFEDQIDIFGSPDNVGTKEYSILLAEINTITNALRRLDSAGLIDNQNVEICSILISRILEVNNHTNVDIAPSSRRIRDNVSDLVDIQNRLVLLGIRTITDRSQLTQIFDCYLRNSNNPVPLITWLLRGDNKPAKMSLYSEPEITQIIPSDLLTESSYLSFLTALTQNNDPRDHFSFKRFINEILFNIDTDERIQSNIERLISPSE